MLIRLIILFLLASFVSACGSRGGRYYQDDGPDSNVPANLASVKNAVPKREARSASGNNPYVVFGRRYVPMTSSTGYRKSGVASWYGRKFHGRRTSSGEQYDMYAMTAAHKTLPLPSYVKVRNLDNNREIIVRVNDRGPFLHKRLIDLSYVAAHKLGVIKTGTARVEVIAVGAGSTVEEAGGVTVAAVDSSLEVEAETLTAPATRSGFVRSANANPGANPVNKSSSTGGVYLQVGSFGKWDNAIKLRNQLEQHDIRPVSIATVRVNSNRYFRVRVGPVENLGKAEQFSKQVQRLGIHDSRVVIE